MTTIITPKSALEQVLAQKTQPLTLGFTLFENKWQKYSLYAAIGSLVSGFVIGTVSKISNDFFPYAALIALILLLLSMLLVVMYQITLALPHFKGPWHPEHSICETIINEFDHDIELIAELADTYGEHHLEYAKNSFSQAASHLRERISLLVGAVEKVGVIPLGITAFFAIRKAVNDGVVVFSEIEYVLCAFVLLYLSAVYMVVVSHKLDQVVLIFDQAMNLKKANQ